MYIFVAKWWEWGRCRRKKKCFWNLNGNSYCDPCLTKFAWATFELCKPCSFIFFSTAALIYSIIYVFRYHTYFLLFHRTLTLHPSTPPKLECIYMIYGLPSWSFNIHKEKYCTCPMYTSPLYTLVYIIWYMCAPLQTNSTHDSIRTFFYPSPIVRK